MEFKPLGKRVLLKREEVETKTKTGILLTSNSSSEKPTSGIIKSISDELSLSHLKIGSKVYFKEYKANEIKINNEEFLVVDIDDILGILN